MATTKTSKPEFHVGEWVTFDLGGQETYGIVADEGDPLSPRRRYTIKWFQDPYEPEYRFRTAEELSHASTDNILTKPLTRDEIAAYLKQSLLWVLMGDIGNPASAVWLTRNDAGRVTHTFLPERGLAGGRAAPYDARRGEKITRSKRDEVVRFVESFGLDRKTAEGIVDAIGTAP